MEWSKIVKRVFILTLSAIMLLGAVLGLSACGIRKTSEEPPVSAETQGADQQAEIEPAESEKEAPIEDPVGETTAEEPSAIEKLAASLPPKPDVNIYSWEYRLANSYNSIGEYQPPYSSFEGQGIDQNAAQAAVDFIQAARNAGFYTWCSTANRNYEYLDSHYRGFVYRPGPSIRSAASTGSPNLYTKPR